MPVTDPFQALKGLQIITTLFLTISFGITIYQVYLNRRQAKVHEQMEKLLGHVEVIRHVAEKNGNKLNRN